MTQIDFYTNVGDKLSTACRIVAKAYGQHCRVVVLCSDSGTAQQVDHALWSVPPTGFIPHCSSSSPLARRTPVVIDSGGSEPQHDQVLVNLCADRPEHFGRFERLVEIVSLDEEDKRAARERFRFYRDRGYPLRMHDLGATAGAGA